MFGRFPWFGRSDCAVYLFHCHLRSQLLPPLPLALSLTLHIRRHQQLQSSAGYLGGSSCYSSWSAYSSSSASVAATAARALTSKSSRRSRVAGEAGYSQDCQSSRASSVPLRQRQTNPRVSTRDSLWDPLAPTSRRKTTPLTCPNPHSSLLLVYQALRTPLESFTKGKDPLGRTWAVRR